MSESENDQTEPESGRVPSPGPPAVPADEASESPEEDTEDTEDKTEKIPGEYPEDNPDLTGEDRFDAG